MAHAPLFEKTLARYLSRRKSIKSSLLTHRWYSCRWLIFGIVHCGTGQHTRSSQYRALTHCNRWHHLMYYDDGAVKVPSSLFCAWKQSAICSFHQQSIGLPAKARTHSSQKRYHKRAGIVWGVTPWFDGRYLAYRHIFTALSFWASRDEKQPRITICQFNIIYIWIDIVVIMVAVILERE